MSKIKNGAMKGLILPIVAALIWGMAFVAQSTSADKEIGPFTFNATRSYIGVVTLYVVYFVFKEIAKKNGTYKKQTPAQNKQLLIGASVCGTILCLCINFQQMGIGGTDVGKASFITALYIVLVPVFGLFFKKKTSPTVWASVLIAVIGLYFLCVNNDFSIAVADLLVVACACLFAFHIIMIDKFANGVDAILFTLVQFAVVGTESAILMFIFEQPSIDVINSCWVEFLYIGILSTGVGYTLQVVTQQGADPTIVSLLFSLESLFGAIGGAIFKKEVMSLKAYIGCLFMLLAVVLSQIPFETIKKIFKKEKSVE